MGLRVRHPVSVFPSSGVLTIRLYDRAGFSHFRPILIRVVVISGIEFIGLQGIPDSFLSTLHVALVNAAVEKPQDA